MNIRYDSNYGFIAEFSTDFHGDLNAVKEAKFRTTGPPSWLWYTDKLASLNKLRENKPISGLTINESAFQQYTKLSEMEALNEAARAAFAPVKEEQKKAKKQRKREEIVARTYTKTVIPAKPGELYDFVGAEDLPPTESKWVEPERPQWTGPRCSYCQQPVYIEYEKVEPVPICLYCEKMLDNAGQVC